MSALVTDQDRLTMMQLCLEQGLTGPAVFELVVRELPADRNFLVAAGLEQALQFLKSLSFSEAEFIWLRDQGGFSSQLLEYARALRFEGDVDAMPEGTVFFAGEPILRVTAALPLAQLVESRLLNLVHFETAIASSAARLVIAAAPRRLIDCGLRRAHGAEAALLAARAAYLAGFEGTATADAARRFGIPVFGTMCLSAADAGIASLAAMARSRPPRTTWLSDTEPPDGPLALVELAQMFTRAGVTLAGVQIDGAEPGARATLLRRALDAAGLDHLGVFAAGDLGEDSIAALVAGGAPIDGFNLRGWFTAASELTHLDAVYAMRQYAGPNARERTDSAGAAMRGPPWPGAHNVERRLGGDGRIECDIVFPEHEHETAHPDVDEPLLRPCMRAGKRVGRAQSLQESRAYHARQIALLPEALQRLTPALQPMRVILPAGLAPSPRT